MTPSIKGCLITILISLSSYPLVLAYYNPPYCNQVLNEKNLVVKMRGQVENHPTYFYDIYSKKIINTGSCEMDHDSPIRITFDQITRISDILIEDLPFVTNPSKIEITVWRGTTAFQCHYKSSSKTKHSGRTFFYFECVDEDGYYNRAGLYVNTIEFKSATPMLVNVTNFESQLPLGWLIPIQWTNENGEQYPEQCPPPGLYPDQMIVPARSFYPFKAKVDIACLADDDFTIESDARICNSNGKWAPNKPPMCPPADRERYAAQSASPMNRRVSVGMRDVSQVFHFNRDLFSIKRIIVTFTTKLSSSEATRTLRDNVVYHVIHSTGDVISEEELGSVNFGDDATEGITTTLAITLPYCGQCSIRMTFREYHWNFWIVKDIAIYASSSVTRRRAERYARLLKECPPVDPYFGMPERYKNYELILNGSINDLLLHSPCRPGYTFTGNKDEIYQCRNGNWNGKGFPECKLIRTKTPPQVDGATWRYVHEDVFHEIEYVTKVAYNLNKDNWFVVGRDAGHRDEL